MSDSLLQIVEEARKQKGFSYVGTIYGMQAKSITIKWLPVEAWARGAS